VLGLHGGWVKDLKDEMSCAVCQDTFVAAFTVAITCASSSLQEVLHAHALLGTMKTLEIKALALQGDWVKDLEDEMSCAVCQETIVAAHSLVPCGHCFCGNCLFQWLSRKQICPTCRSVTALTLSISCKEVVCQSCRSVTAFTLRILCKEVVCLS